MQNLLISLAQNALLNLPETIISVFMMVLVPFLVMWVRARLNIADLEKLIALVDIVYNMVENTSRKTPTTVDDKAALAIKFLRDQFKVVLSKKQEEKVRGLLDARHNVEKKGGNNLGGVAVGSVVKTVSGRVIS